MLHSVKAIIERWFDSTFGHSNQIVYVMGKRTQKTVLLEHLQTFGCIEPLTALRKYGIYRLGARVADLRSEGYNIKTETMTSISRITGRPVHYAKYVLQ